MLSIYILILGLISGVTMETCPEPEDIFPCKCTELKIIKTILVDCNTFTRTPMTLKGLEHVLNGLRGKNNVALHLYHIEDTLPSNIFSGIGIKFLNIWASRMDSFTNDDQPGLLGLENHLEILDIHTSDFSSMKLHLGHLNKLRSLTFFANNIPELDDDWLSDVPSSLKNLYFWGNSIGKIGSHAFSRLNSLRTLYLDDNRFGPMKRSMFPDRLEMLSLKNNTLTDLPVDLFSRMPSIVFVGLNENKISTLDERTWSPIWQQLQHIELEKFQSQMLPIYILILGFISGVTMETCPEPEDIYPCQCTERKLIKTILVKCDSFSKTTMTLKKLRHVLNGILGKNNVVLHLHNIQDTLPSDIFSGIGIRRLQFRSCLMDNLTNADQPGLLGLENHLQVLEIYDTYLSPMKLHLGHLNKLRNIDLRGNNIPELEDDWLSDVPPSLTELHLWHNNIGKIGNHAFSRMDSLQTLWLYDNGIGHIKRSMFPDRLEILYLMNNTLTDLPVDIFSRMPLLFYVSLDNNRITTLDEQTWSPIWQQLKFLKLEDNNIVCDDRLNWIMKSKRRPKISGECSAPKELEKTSLEEFFKSKSR